MEGEVFERFSRYARDRKMRLEDAAKLAIERMIDQKEEPAIGQTADHIIGVALMRGEIFEVRRGFFRVVH